MSRRFSKRTRLLSFLLSVAMVMMFLPVAAFADSGNRVRVCGTWLDSATRSIDLDEGTVEYDPETNTLTLTNADIKFDSTAVIYYNNTDGLIINLVGENKINTQQTGILGGNPKGTLTLTGEGSLSIYSPINAIVSDDGLIVDSTTIDITSDSCAVWVAGDVTIKNSTFKSASTDGNAIYPNNGNLIATDSDITVTGTNYPAVWADAGISITGGKLTASAPNHTAFGTDGKMSISNCTVEATGEFYALLSNNGMTLTNCDVTAKADDYVALFTGGAMVIDGGSVKAYSYNDAGVDAYAIQINPYYDWSADEYVGEGTLEIGGGAEVYVEGYQGIMASNKTTIEDAHIIINSEAWSIDMPVRFADGYDIARAIGGATKADAEPFDWYSMSLESGTKNQPGTYHYLELLSGSVHTLTVRNGFVNVNGKDCTEDTVQVAAGSTVTLTVDDSAFSSDFVFRSWSVNPTPDDMGNEYARTISFTMPASDVDACAMNRLADEPGYDDRDPFADAAMIAGGAAAVGLAGFGIYELGTELYLKAVLPEGADIPTTRGELALLLWNDAGKPEPAEQPAFTDISDADTAKAAQWVVEAGLMTAEDDTFAPAKRVFKWDVIKAWRQAAKR